jgi:hypothetical protein
MKKENKKIANSQKLVGDNEVINKKSFNKSSEPVSEQNIKQKNENKN